MTHSPFRRGLAGMLTSFALFALSNLASAQSVAKPEKVKFDTFDGVELHGTFYPGGKGNLSPCVILLHPLDSDRVKAGWDVLAKELQPNYAVLTFDFRGHGESDSVQSNFWTQPKNMKIKGASPKNPVIASKNFPRDYWPVLVNDILAAKRFLDRQNDANRCNSSNLIVIGADDAAALGAFYLTAEWKRELPNLLPRNQWPVAGTDIAAAVWLSMNPSVKGTTMPVSQWFSLTPSMSRVPMNFIYPGDDTRAKSSATSLEKALKASRAQNKLTKQTPIKEAKKTTGIGLVKSSPKIRADIVKYLDDVMEVRGFNAPQKKDVERMPNVEIPLNWFLQGRH